MSSSPSVWWVGVAHLFSFQCYVSYFVCLCTVSCVLNVACVSGLSLLDYPFGLFRVIIGVVPPYTTGAPEFTPGFCWGSCYSIFSFICMFFRSLFVLLSFSFWPLCCLFFFYIRILIAALVSSNSS